MKLKNPKFSTILNYGIKSTLEQFIHDEFADFCFCAGWREAL